MDIKPIKNVRAYNRALREIEKLWNARRLLGMNGLLFALLRVWIPFAPKVAARRNTSGVGESFHDDGSVLNDDVVVVAEAEILVGAELAAYDDRVPHGGGRAR